VPLYLCNNFYAVCTRGKACETSFIKIHFWRHLASPSVLSTFNSSNLYKCEFVIFYVKISLHTVILIIYYAVCKYNCVRLFSAVRMVYNKILYTWYIIRYFGQLKSLPDSWNSGVVSCRPVVLTSHIIQNRYILGACLESNKGKTRQE